MLDQQMILEMECTNVQREELTTTLMFPWVLVVP